MTPVIRRSSKYNGHAGLPINFFYVASIRSGKGPGSIKVVQHIVHDACTNINPISSLISTVAFYV